MTINIQDDFLSREHYNELCNFSIEYNKVHWIGRKSAPKNPLYALVSKTYPNDENLTGATAWYNVRPIDPKYGAYAPLALTLSPLGYTTVGYPHITTPIIITNTDEINDHISRGKKGNYSVVSVVVVVLQCMCV